MVLSSSNQQKPDTIWYTRCPSPTISSVAIAQGWLNQEFGADGIQVASLSQSTQREVQESHFNHSQPNSFRQGGNIPSIWVRSQSVTAQKPSTKLIGLTWIDQYQAILALPESGIRTVKDLKGRRLALPRRVKDTVDFWRSICLHGYVSALKTEGLTVEDVDLVDLPLTETYLGTSNSAQTSNLFGSYKQKRLQSTEVFALIRREVDAIYVSGALGVELQAFLGATVVLEISKYPDPAIAINNITPSVLVVSEDLAAERPDLVSRYVAQLLKAAEWAKSHPAETRRIIAQEVGVAEEWIAHAYHPELHAQLAPALSDELIAAIVAQKDFLLEQKIIPHDFDIHDWIDPRPLEMALSAV